MKNRIIKLLSDYKANPSKETMLPLYNLYNEIYFHQYKENGFAKRGKYRDFSKRCGSGCDKPVIAGLRSFAGLGVDKDGIGRFKYQERLAICKACKHHTSTLGLTWCGKPLTGGTTKEGKLCGCEMEIKCGLKNEICSLDTPKWI